MEYSVYIHPTVYKEVILKLSSNNQDRINNLVQQLAVNPYVGDQLQIKYIREKRFDDKRIYHVVFEDLKAVLIVVISDKKTQQKTIDSIKLNINKYRDYVKSIMDSELS